MTREHLYRVKIGWTGATTGYRAYSRDHRISAEGCPDILGSSDRVFLGSEDRWSPEQLFVASIAACHKLWFLHLAAEAGLVVTAYADEAEGAMSEDEAGGRFTAIRLAPRVALATGDATLLPSIHAAAHARCFLANSVNFPVSIHASSHP